MMKYLHSTTGILICKQYFIIILHTTIIIIDDLVNMFQHITNFYRASKTPKTKIYFILE